MFSTVDLGLTLLAGLLTTLQPCVLPLIPIVVGGAINENRFAPIYIGMGMVVFYALIGAVTGFLEPLFGLEPAEFKTFGGGVMVVTGLILLIPRFSFHANTVFSGMIDRLNNATAKISTANPWGGFLLGGVLSLVWAPCAGPMLASAISLLTQDSGGGVDSVWRGAVMLGVYGIGAAVPLVLLAYLTRTVFSNVREKLLRTQRLLTTVMAVMLLVFGVLIVTGWMKFVEQYLLTVLPESWIGFVISI